MDYPEPNVVEPTKPHTHTVVFLHGRGGSGEEIKDTFEGCRLSAPPKNNLFNEFPNIKWIFPNAKERFSVVFKENLTQWFDIYSLTDPTEKMGLQIGGIKEAVIYLRGLLETEVGLLGGDASKVIIGGISQGEATALMLLITSSLQFGGFVGFSGWIPFSQLIQGILAQESSSKEKKSNEAIRQTLSVLLGLEPSPSSSDVTRIPVFLGHGEDDGFIDFRHGYQVNKLLARIGYPVEFHEYLGAELGGHWFKEPEGLDDLDSFLKAIISDGI